MPSTVLQRNLSSFWWLQNETSMHMSKTKSRFTVKFFERSTKSNYLFSETSALFIIKTLFETLFGYVNSNWKQPRFKILALNYFCGFSL